MLGNDPDIRLTLDFEHVTSTSQVTVHNLGHEQDITLAQADPDPDW